MINLQQNPSESSIRNSALSSTEQIRDKILNPAIPDAPYQKRLPQIMVTSSSASSTEFLAGQQIKEEEKTKFYQIIKTPKRKNRRKESFEAQS